jgi:hypothetical protein
MRNFSSEWKRGKKNRKSDFLAQIFADPKYKFVGSLESAKMEGVAKNCWILVNIQNTENFSSHCLNRDVWKDKDLAPVIKSSFVFFQFAQRSETARRIVNLYSLTSIPAVFVIDPNTGRKEHTFVVPDEPDRVSQMSAKILEFLDNYPNPKDKPKQRPLLPPPKKNNSNNNNNNNNNNIDSDIRAALPTGDYDLAAAIAASMQSSSDTNDSNADVGMLNTKEEAEAEAEVEAEAEAEVLPPKPVLSEEPAKDDPNSTAVRMRMPSGQIAQRRFLKTTVVQELFVWCSLCNDGRNDIKIIQRMPRMNLEDVKNETLLKLGLLNVALVCSFED